MANRNSDFQRQLPTIAAVLIGCLALVGYYVFNGKAVSAASTGPGFVAFESGPVRPVAMSADAMTLFAVNIPNATLEIFDLSSGTPVPSATVPVGLEPVAVAVRNNSEVWVVNHLSDSVSVVSLVGMPRVVRTLLVGDEPRDIVFAGTPARAFITTAHRGQQREDPSLTGVPGAGDPQLTTASVPRADVWVFDPADSGATLGGKPLKVMSFFTDTPRALAVSPDRNTVYVAGFKTGNQTTTVLQERLCEGFKPTTPCTLSDNTISPGGNPGPRTDAKGEPAPEVSLIVKYNNATGHWEDELHRNWDDSVRFKLPDTDAFSIDANSLTQTAAFAHVGTTLYNMAVNPVSGKLYVSNTESLNQIRFEGPGTFAGQTVQGHLAETRITVISNAKGSSPSVEPRHLNKHIDYTKLAGTPGFDPSAKDASLSTPLDMAVSSDGKTLYLAAYGSSRIGVFDTTSLEDGSFDPRVSSANYISISGGGPAGIVLDEARAQLYVMTRFDNSIRAIDLASRREIATIAMPNPEPPSVVNGRPMLYDATRFSGNGEASCASCHAFGDMDDLAWDLGNPDGEVTKSPIPINLGNLLNFGFANGIQPATPLNGSNKPEDFHPMKGPFTTQSLRGLRHSGAMHWRGDRATGTLGTSAFDPNTSFNNFIVAFQGLVGSEVAPPIEQMQAFTDFQLQVLPPPNPVRNLDNSLTAAQKRGRDFYSGQRASDGVESPIFALLGLGQTSFTCDGCHTLDSKKGFFGTGGNQSFENLTQIVKIPHLRNLYAKVGMFGTPTVGFYNLPGTPNMGDQIRGFGFTGDGGTDTLFRFFTASVFTPSGNVGFPVKDPDATRRDMERFMLAYDSDLAPIVGQQVTLSMTNALTAGARIDLFIQRSAAAFMSKALPGAVTECDLTATLVLGGNRLSFLYDPAAKTFQSADGALKLTDADLRKLAASPGQEITYTATTPGAGMRMAFGR